MPSFSAASFALSENPSVVLITILKEDLPSFILVSCSTPSMSLLSRPDFFFTCTLSSGTLPSAAEKTSAMKPVSGKQPNARSISPPSRSKSFLRMVV